MSVRIPGDMPPGYDIVSVQGAAALCLSQARRWVEGALNHGWTLHGAARDHPDARELYGRGTVYVIPGVKGEGYWAVRHYHRGGWMSALLDDRYLDRGDPRPFRELRVSEAVRATEVKTPRVVAAAIYPSRWLYRADLVTEFVPHSKDLAHVLFGGDKVGLGGSADRRDGLEAAGKLIREMARSGVYHPDLNAGNILLRWFGSAPDPYLLDLDRARVGEPDPGLVRSLHARLERSLRKLEKRSGRNLSPEEYRVLEEGAQRPW